MPALMGRVVCSFDAEAWWVGDGTCKDGGGSGCRLGVGELIPQLR
jgi:hypothetical protein